MIRILWFGVAASESKICTINKTEDPWHEQTNRDKNNDKGQRARDKGQGAKGKGQRTKDKGQTTHDKAGPSMGSTMQLNVL